MYSINKKRLIKTFTDLVTISSPSWKEEKVINYIIKQCERINIPYKKYRCNNSYNLLLRMRGNSKRRPALFSAHMDTVTPCDNVKPVQTETRISSDGTSILGSDDKSAIAMFLESLRFIKETGMPHGPIEILLSCAEEVGLYGIKCFDLSELKARHAFVFDSDGAIGKIIIKAPYHSTMKIEIKGKPAHAGMEPEKGINAITVLSEIITQLPSGRIDSETTMNIGTISGGRATNIVAEDATCVLEVRSINNNKLKDVEKVIRETVKKIASRDGARFSISRTLEYSGFTIKPSSPVARIAQSALNRLGIDHAFEVSGGGSDTNILNKGGIRSINLSSGMRKVHTNKEYILIRDLINGTRLVLSIIETI